VTLTFDKLFRKAVLMLALSLLIKQATAEEAGAVSLAEVRSRIQQATAGFRDLRMDVEIAFADQKELAVIGKDYGRAYEFKRSQLVFKDPDKLKMTARAGLVNVTYIVTGDMKRVKAGLIKKTDDIGDEPHKKQNALDAGIVTGSLWQFFNVEGVRTESLNGVPCYVLTLSLANSPQKKQYIWVDAKDLKLLRREKREADGSLRVRYVYSGHRRVNGIWVPGEQRVFNGHGRLGGTSVYSNIRINSGVSDSEFR
jgi:outer membrane lipoprotein-sorting protein